MSEDRGGFDRDGLSRPWFFSDHVPCGVMPSFHLVADVSSASPDGIRAVVAQLFPTGVTETAAGASTSRPSSRGESARDLNRTVLSALRKAEKRTRLRAAWTSGGTTERFFDYVPKGSRPGRLTRHVTNWYHTFW
jgi:hypothetical protein